MVTCQSSELGWKVTVELPADFLSLGRGSVTYCWTWVKFRFCEMIINGELYKRVDVRS